MSRSNNTNSDSTERPTWWDDDLRRSVLITLVNEPSESLSLEYLVEQVINCDSNDYHERDRLALRLHHVLLPSLEALGVLTYTGETHQLDVDRETAIHLLYDSSVPIPDATTPTNY